MEASSEKIADLKARVASDPFDVSSWEQLLGEISRGRKSDEQASQLRETYEDLLSKFPLAASYWKEYCELEMDSGTPEAVKTLFSRCLLTCLDIDLWRTYLRFILKLHQPLTPDGVAEIKQSYEFALDHVGQDVRSGPIWQEYITFLETPKINSPHFSALFGNAPEGQEDSQRTAILRRAYHRALLVPDAALDTLWSGYEKFENSSGNKTLTKRLLDEWRPRYQAARALLKERSALVDRLDHRALPLPPGRGGIRQARQATAWREYIAWERKNEQNLDSSAYQARVILAYEQALPILLQYPETWLDYAAWHSFGGGAGADAGTQVLHRGRVSLPTALILHFAAAEAEEEAGALDAAKGVYEELLGKLVVADGTATAIGKKQPDAASADASADESQQQQQQSIFTQRDGTLIWVHYMRYTRRTAGIMAARKLFLRARKWEALGWEAFVASAHIEWAHEAKDQIPRNIFELGLKSFLTEPGYVLQYASFLQGLGDLANLRGLFERSLSETPKETALPLWDAYTKIEYEAGSLAAARAVEVRRREALGDDAHGPFDVAHVALVKYKYLDLWPGKESHFRALEAGEINASSTALFPAKTRLPGGGDDYAEGAQYEGGDLRRGYQPPPQQHQRQPSPMGAPSSADPSEPIRKFPRDIALLINTLSTTPDGPVPDISQVIDVILRADFSLEGVDAHEVAASKERRRQRIAKEQAAGGVGVGAGGVGIGGGQPGFGKRKLEDASLAEESESGDSDDDGNDGMDVYRRRMRARV